MSRESELQNRRGKCCLDIRNSIPRTSHIAISLSTLLRKPYNILGASPKCRLVGDRNSPAGRKIANLRIVQGLTYAHLTAEDLRCQVSEIYLAGTHPESSSNDDLIVAEESSIVILLELVNKKYIKIEASNRGADWQNTIALVENNNLGTAANVISCPTSKVIKSEEMLDIVVKHHVDQTSEPKNDTKAVRLWVSRVFHELEDNGIITNAMERVEMVLKAL